MTKERQSGIGTMLLNIVNKAPLPTLILVLAFLITKWNSFVVMEKDVISMKQTISQMDEQIKDNKFNIQKLEQKLNDWIDFIGY